MALDLLPAAAAGALAVYLWFKNRKAGPDTPGPKKEDPPFEPDPIPGPIPEGNQSGYQDMVEEWLADPDSDPEELRAYADFIEELSPELAQALRTRADEREAEIYGEALKNGGWPYTIKNGDTPYGVSLAYDSGDVVAIKKANGLSAKTVNGVTLYSPWNIGQVIRLPMSWKRPGKGDPANPGPGLPDPCGALKKQYDIAYERYKTEVKQYPDKLADMGPMLAAQSAYLACKAGGPGNPGAPSTTVRCPELKAAYDAQAALYSAEIKSSPNVLHDASLMLAAKGAWLACEQAMTPQAKISKAKGGDCGGKGQCCSGCSERLRRIEPTGDRVEDAYRLGIALFRS